jgi:hypothetical protein
MLTEEEEKELKLRDQFAMAAMQGILAGAADSMDFELDTTDKAEIEKGLEEFATVAYMIADAMRKARLASFK